MCRQSGATRLSPRTRIRWTSLPDLFFVFEDNKKIKKLTETNDARLAVLEGNIQKTQNELNISNEKLQQAESSLKIRNAPISTAKPIVIFKLFFQRNV